MTTSLIWLVVFLSLHACNARHHLVDREKIGEELDNIKAPCMEDELFKLGKKTKPSSSQEIPELTISLKEKFDNKLRRKLGLKLDEGKESANSMEDKEEEIVVMDYVQPHRKPPIHNKETLN